MAGIALSMTAQAKTILWHHFDERAPGETAQAADVFVNAVSSEYGSGEAHSIDTGTTLGTDPDFMPTFVKRSFYEPILDPVSGAVHTNTAAIGFHTAGTSSALAGGAVIIKNDPAFWLTNYTVECFVCTTGGAFNLIAPIVGKITGSGGFTSESWQIGILQNGKIFIRCAQDLSSTSGSGSHTLNDGVWHHVALTCSYDEETGKSTFTVYVDHEYDFSKSVNNVTPYQTSTANFNNAIYIGGYQNAGRKFNGMIDELRLSDEALSPAQFLRRVAPSFVDADTLIWAPLDVAYGAYAVADQNLVVGHSVLALPKGDPPAAEFTNDTVSATVRDDMSAPPTAENVTSLFLKTNGVVGVGTGLAASSYPYTATNLTAELFFKTYGKMFKTGNLDHSQVLFKISDSPFLQVSLDQLYPGQVTLVYSNLKTAGSGDPAAGKWTSAGYFGTDLHDGKWHHVAAVYDADNETIKLYIDYRLAKTCSNVRLSSNNCEIGIGAKPRGTGSSDNRTQFFHGCIDSVRFTQRVLEPTEFLSSTKSVLANDIAEMVFHAQFDGDYEAQSGDFIIAADAYSRGYEGCEEPTFSPEVRYPELRLDGEGGTCTKTNEASVYLNGSTVFFRNAPGLGGFDQTVEFFCKLSSLPTLAGIARVNTAGATLEAGTPIWAFYAGEVGKLQFRCSTVTNGVVNTERYLATGIPISELVDDEWHHVAITLQAVDDNANTQITVYIDGSQRWTSKISGTLYSTANNSVVFGASSRADGNIVGYIDEFRILRGVQPPSRFLCRYRRPKGLVVSFR